MKSNKIALISPKSCFFFNNQENNKILEGLPGFDVHKRYWSGLGPALPILASLTDKEFDIEIIDENIEEINFDKNYSMVAITSMTHQAIRAYQISSEFRKKGIHTVIGGIHASFMPEEAKKFADTVVIGEAENIWPILLNDFTNNKIKTFYNQKDYPVVNIYELPIPRYELLANKNYKIIWLNTSRGCPYNCEFCIATEFFGKKQKQKNISQVCKEIEFIQQNFKRILIGFGDNNMFINRKFSKILLEKFINLNFNWICQSDISIGKDINLLKLLFKAGCRTIFIGFESLDKDNLENIYQKNTVKLKSKYLEHYEEMIYNIQSNGIGIWGSFVIGFKNDTISTFEKIADFINKNKMLGAHITILTPLPGSRLREKMISENRLLPTSWDNYTFGDLNFIPYKVTEKEMQNGVINAFKKIYTEKNRKDKTLFFKNIMKKLYEI